MKILVINGPNLNMLGVRDPKKYGRVTLEKVKQELLSLARQHKVEIIFYQSNHEGAIIDFLQKESSRNADGVVINPGALTRYGYSLRQALVDLNKPVVEIHMSNINRTGVNKTVNVFDDVRVDQVMGFKEKSYYIGFKRLIEYIRK